MAQRRSRQFYASQTLGPRRLLVFGLPALVAGALLLAHNRAGNWMDDYIWTITPVALAALGVFGYGLLQISLDLHEQREINKRLKELQAHHGLAEGLALMGSWVLDLAQDRFYWSEGCHQVFGIAQANGAPSRQAFFICIHPDDQQRWKEAHRRGISKGETIKLEYRYVKNGNDTIWVRSVAEPEYDSDGKRLLRLAGFAQDITLINSMKAELVAREQKYRTLTELSSDWEWEMDANFQIRKIIGRLDPALARWRDRVLDHCLWDSNRIEGMKPNDWADLKEHLKEGSEFRDLKFTLLAPDDQLFTIQLSGRPVRDAMNSLIGYQGIGRNVTAQTQQEILLELENTFTKLMREHDDASDVLVGVIRTVCEQMGWLGGALFKLIDGTQSLIVRERWGNEAVIGMLSELPRHIPLNATSYEKSVRQGQAFWLNNTAREPAFAQRYQTAKISAEAALITPILDEKDNVLATLMFFSPQGFQRNQLIIDITQVLSRTMSLYLQRKSAESRLRRASQHDALTGLPNRAYLSEQLENRLHRKEPLSLLYIDLDRYKAINDTLGHQAGDQVLIEVARRFKAAIGPGNIAARMGGDEFVLLLDKQNDARKAEAMGRKVLEAVERPFILKGRAHFLSASIGIALSPHHGSDASTLIRCADNAMYTVKSEGRNDVRIFSKSAGYYRGSQQLTADLPLAMERGEVELFYQPVISMLDRQVASIEALIRWRHPELGLLLPESFLPLAEQSNLMRQVGIWTIRRALDDRIALGLDAHEDMAVSVNITPNQMNEEGFLAQVSSLLHERRLPGRLLRLELTENALIEGSSKTRTQLAALRKLDVQVMIDNFGTGYASLSNLRSMPISGLKIDHALIEGLPGDRGNAAIVQAIMTLADKLSLKVIAEGVSSREEMMALRDFGCTRMQGNFIARPLSLTELRAFLKNSTSAPAAASAPGQHTRLAAR